MIGFKSHPLYPLPNKANYAYQAYLKNHILHFFATTCLSQKEWHEIDKMILLFMGSFMSLNRHFSCAFLISPIIAEGLNFTSVFEMQANEKLRMLTSHLHLSSNFGEL